MVIDFEEEWNNIKSSVSVFFKLIFFKSNVKRLIRDFECLNRTTFSRSKYMIEAYNSLLTEVRGMFTILDGYSMGTIEFKRNMSIILFNLQGEIEEVIGNVERNSHEYRHRLSQEKKNSKQQTEAPIESSVANKQ